MDKIEKELFEQIQEEAAYEMARVGNICDNIQIWIRSNDGGNVPHVHFFTKDLKINGCIKLDKPEYFDHGG